MRHLQILVFRFLVLADGNERADLQGVRDVLVAIASKGGGRALLIKHFGLLLRIVLHHHGLRRVKIVYSSRISANHGRVIELVPLILHDMHKLVLGQAIVNLATWLLGVIEDLGVLVAKLLGGFTLAG